MMPSGPDLMKYGNRNSTTTTTSAPMPLQATFLRERVTFNSGLSERMVLSRFPS